MARRTILTVIVLVAILGLLYWYQQTRDNDETASENAELMISVFNQTKNQDGTSVAASPNDVLIYTLDVENTADETISGYVVETNIDDISELATLTDASGANYNAANNSLMWTPLDIPGLGSIQKQFTVRVKDPVPTGTDRVMSASFGNEVTVSVSDSGLVVTPVPTPEQKPSYQAPTAGPSMWFAFLLAIAFTAGIVLYKAAKSINV